MLCPIWCLILIHQRHFCDLLTFVGVKSAHSIFLFYSIYDCQSIRVFLFSKQTYFLQIFGSITKVMKRWSYSVLWSLFDLHYNNTKTAGFWNLMCLLLACQFMCLSEKLTSRKDTACVALLEVTGRLPGVRGCQFAGKKWLIWTQNFYFVHVFHAFYNQLQLQAVPY